MTNTKEQLEIEILEDLAEVQEYLYEVYNHSPHDLLDYKTALRPLELMDKAMSVLNPQPEQPPQLTTTSLTRLILPLLQELVNDGYPVQMLPLNTMDDTPRHAGTAVYLQGIGYDKESNQFYVME